MLYDAAKILRILSALLQAIGLYLLYRSTFGFAIPGAFLLDHESQFKIDRQNASRRRGQRWGFGLVLTGLALQILPEFF